MLSFLDRARKKRADGEAGFTLIELLVVVVILGILIAIAIPVYLNYRKSANDKAAQSDLRNAISTLEVCNSDGAGYPTAMTGTAPTAALTGCTSQSVKLSTGTLYKYTPPTATVLTYQLSMGSTGGSGKIYCYNSANGGGVAPATATGSAQADVNGATC